MEFSFNIAGRINNTCASITLGDATFRYFFPKFISGDDHGKLVRPNGSTHFRIGKKLAAHQMRVVLGPKTGSVFLFAHEFETIADKGRPWTRRTRRFLHVYRVEHLEDGRFYRVIDYAGNALARVPGMDWKVAQALIEKYEESIHTGVQA